ncbi:GbsR/MarR family transcriptional regulator [Streptomyces qinzhouensis]|uniref:Helix-turn-helix domain-containing protein n=1 Tax=Streptomyces qinzhouensis TaxID=2599401 RepID=A0A5B8J5W8_9ACTN|nr:helix-turn-helix domain-containing protein [Streptomyces qinzhouensis]QDY77195.1 helix-turn-helix domain-containing protein [Streptomyces qinzhouensis]
MPGGRLTEDERRLIAGWLSEGLGYAEAARRLGRPTSTVSREVARNGGPGAYRADHAHRATAWRARRSGGRTAPASGGDRSTEPEEARLFWEQFAAAMAATGLPRMAARVLTELFTTDSGSLTAAELALRLRVSPASVSKAVGYLEGLGTIRRERDREPGRRRDRYVVDDDLWLSAWNSGTDSTARWAGTALRGAELLGTETPAGARLHRTALFFHRLAADMAAGPVPAADGDRVLTLLAALVEAGGPRTTDALAAALGWPAERVAQAVATAVRHPELTDPLALRETAPGSWTAAARPGRLSPAQRTALAAPGAP